MSEGIELSDRGVDRPDVDGEDFEDNEETDFGGRGLLDDVDWLTNRGRDEVTVEHMDPLNKYFGDEIYKARNIGYFFNDVLQLERECENPKFIKYLMERKEFEIRKTISIHGLIADYVVSYLHDESDGDTVWHDVKREVKTVDGVIEDKDLLDDVGYEIRQHYDEWRELELKKKLKRAGIVGGIALSLSGIVAGLVLGLKRKGTDLKNDAERKDRKTGKLTPSTKIDIIPWTGLETAAGDGLIWIGDNIYLVIGGTLLYVSTRGR